MDGSRFEFFGGHSREYWLRNCHGFEVRSASGHKLGVVIDVLFETRSDRPDYLVVQRGIVRIRRERIPVDNGADFDLRERRITVGEPDAAQ
jgi:uncharacterized protein YrrD